MKAAPIKPVRCAIYTRVSTDQGLDQEFNSLDAQYDASSAYIKSQAHAGWALIKARYDDGGYSGGSTDLTFKGCWTTFVPARSTLSSFTRWTG
jgi:site-specific DNA recombinase